MKENTHKHFKRHVSPVYRFDCYKFWHTEYDYQCEGYKTATENIPGFFIKYIGECWYIFIQSVDQLNAVGFFRRPFVNHPVVLTLLGTWKGNFGTLELNWNIYPLFIFTNFSLLVYFFCNVLRYGPSVWQFDQRFLQVRLSRKIYTYLLNIRRDTFSPETNRKQGNMRLSTEKKKILKIMEICLKFLKVPIMCVYIFSFSLKRRELPINIF